MSARLQTYFPIVPFVMMLGFSSAVIAQDKKGSVANAGDERGHFVAYVAPVLSDVDTGSQTPLQLPSDARLVHLGAGGEAAIAHYFGVGTEFGGVPNAAHNGTIAVISLNAYLHALGRRHPHLDPYGTAGYSGFFATGQKSGGFNLGAGVNCWTRGALGMMIELRQSFGTTYREIRFGIAIRQ